MSLDTLPISPFLISNSNCQSSSMSVYVPTSPMPTYAPPPPNFLVSSNLSVDNNSDLLKRSKPIAHKVNTTNFLLTPHCNEDNIFNTHEKSKFPMNQSKRTSTFSCNSFVSVSTPENDVLFNKKLFYKIRLNFIRTTLTG